jgi:general secretion pathway protein K
MEKIRLANNRGIALLMTLAFITLAMSLAVETNRQARLAIESTDALQRRFLAGQMAAAGVHGAMAVLILDRCESDTDHLKETWADPDLLAEALQPLAFEEGRLAVRITDEMARLQVNALLDFPQNSQFNPRQQQIMIQLIDTLQNVNEVPSDLSAVDIVNAIKDWLDRGDDDAITGLNGAESDYYETLTPPYRCRNGPMAHIGELAQVKGVTTTLFQGRANVPGLKDCLTVFGADKSAGDKVTFSGRVNLNTVSLPVLAAILPPEYRDLAEAILQYRAEAEAEVLAGQAWYREIPGAAGLEMNQEAFVLTTDTFRIQASAEHGGIRREISAVVERLNDTEGKGWTCRILAWEIS